MHSALGSQSSSLPRSHCGPATTREPTRQFRAITFPAASSVLFAQVTDLWPPYGITNLSGVISIGHWELAPEKTKGYLACSAFLSSFFYFPLLLCTLLDVYFFFFTCIALRRTCFQSHLTMYNDNKKAFIYSFWEEEKKSSKSLAAAYFLNKSC